MTVTQLHARYAELFGEKTSSRNRKWLIRRIACRLPAEPLGDVPAFQQATALESETKHDASVTVQQSPKPIAADDRVVSNWTIEQTVYFGRRGRRFANQNGPDHRNTAITPGRIPKISRLMALAIHFDELIREGQVTNYAELARVGRVSRNRVTQIMGLLLLAPEIQEQLLFLPRVERGKDPLYLKDLLPMTRQSDWHVQKQLWERFKRIISRGRQG